MAQTLEHELQRHAVALRRLARALVGEHDADDVVQETTLLALRRAPGPGPLGGWLAAVVRRLAHRHRRGEERRRRREARAAKPEALPPDPSAADRDLLRRLTDAVLALPEPYRTAVMLRYLRDQSPAAIAQQTGAPLATVKTRLVRGLALLRERLDRDARGADWRSALGVSLGIGRLETPASAATAAAGTGVVLGGLAAAAAVVAILGLAGGEPQPAAPSRTLPAAATPAAVAAVPPEREAPAGPPAARVAVPAAPAFTLRGRCVDAAGAALAAVSVGLRASKILRDGDEVGGFGEWLVGHPDFVWQDLSIETDAEGRFEFRFEPAPLGYKVWLQRDAELQHVVRIGALPARDALDLGDLVVPATVTLHGRVVDTDGLPVPSPWVGLTDNAAKQQAPFRVEPRIGEANTGPGGTFTAAVVPGWIRATVMDCTIERGERFEVPAGVPRHPLEIVVAKSRAGTITGTVVDTSGRPVPGVKVTGWAGTVSLACTDADGRFALHRPDGRVDDAVQIGCVRQGYEPLWPKRMWPWGTTDLTFELQPGCAIELHVTAAADGSPVEQFQVRVWPAPGNPVPRVGQEGRRMGLLADPQGHGLARTGARGVARIDGVARGAHVLLVEPDRQDLARSAFVAVHVVPAGPARVDVALLANGQRTLRVQHADGAPAAEVGVELADPLERPLEVGTRIAAPDGWSPGGEPTALRLQQGRTDAEGLMTLRGPTDRRLALRLTTPGGARQVVAGVALADRTPLVVTVERAARLEGRLGPPAIVQSLRFACGLAADELLPRRGQVNQPGFRLHRGDGAHEETVPPRDQPAVLVAADGTFVFESAPAGAWELQLDTWTFDKRGSGGLRETVAEVVLQEGATGAVAVDLSGWLPGSLEGTVRRNGESLAERGVMVVAAWEGSDGRTRRQWHSVRTDAQGRFVLRMRPGTASVRVLEQLAPVTRTLRAPESVFVPAGGTVVQSFEVGAGTLRVRLLGADGRPVAGLSLYLCGPDGELWSETEASDANGLVTCTAESMPLSVQVLPRRLLDPAALRELWQQAGDVADPTAPHRVTLGTVEVPRGAGIERELRLPAAWYR